VLITIGGCGGRNSEAGHVQTAPEQAALAAHLHASDVDDRAALSVRLAFGADADLDLYVTDPLEETVYFANSPTRSGGALAADLTCDSPAPRTEVVVFRDPLPGRYRIGIDYSKGCRSPRRSDWSATGWALQLDGPGLDERKSGRIEPLRFESIVLEVLLGQ